MATPPPLGESAPGAFLVDQRVVVCGSEEYGGVLKSMVGSLVSPGIRKVLLMRLDNSLVLHTLQNRRELVATH